MQIQILICHYGNYIIFLLLFVIILLLALLNNIMNIMLKNEKQALR